MSLWDWLLAAWIYDNVFDNKSDNKTCDNSFNNNSYRDYDYDNDDF